MFNKNKKIAIVSIIIFLLLFSFYYNTRSIEKSKMLFAVYNEDNCNVIQGNIITWANLDEYESDFDSMKGIVENVLSMLEIKGKIEVTKNENDDKLEYIAKRNARDVETYVKIESNKKEKKSYLTINIIIYDKVEAILYVQKSLESVYKRLGLKYKMNITLAGSYDKVYSRSDYETLAKNICKMMKAKKVNDFRSDKIYSIYGYTDHIKDYVMVNKKKVNINVALRYNEYEDKTYLYIATPIITTDY